MLRAQAFEGLFTLVPILLVAVVSIILRARAARRRKQREEAARGEPARGEPARGAPARGAPARVSEGTQSSAGPRTAGAGPQSAPARGAPARAAGQPMPPKQGRSATRASQFPWQRETVETTPSYTEPFTPHQPGKPQITNRESYAYPPPLYLNEAKSPAADAGQPWGAPVPRPTGRPSMVVPKREQTLRERMAARARSVQPAAKAAAAEPASITDRLQRLPPLKRAVIWAEILGPPGGRQ